MEFLSLEVFAMLIFKLNSEKIMLYVNDEVVEKEGGLFTKVCLHL